MLRVAACFLALMVAPAFAQDERLPDALLGKWETIPANCSNADPTEGQELSFIRQDDRDIISRVDWATEGGSCDVVMIQHELPLLQVFANCSAEEGPQEATELWYVAPDDNTLVSDSDVTFHRCR